MSYLWLFHPALSLIFSHASYGLRTSHTRTWSPDLSYLLKHLQTSCISTWSSDLTHQHMVVGPRHHATHQHMVFGPHASAHAPAHGLRTSRISTWSSDHAIIQRISTWSSDLTHQHMVVGPYTSSHGLHTSQLPPLSLATANSLSFYSTSSIIQV